jgi:type 1 fimbria pilin
MNRKLQCAFLTSYSDAAPLSERSLGIRVLLPLISLLVGALSPMAQAASHETYIGEHADSGVLYVHGALTENVCRLDMTSARQDVQLGNIDTASLQNVGDRGEPVSVTLKLRDCMIISARQRDSLGNLTWSASQPGVSVMFTAPEDDDNPQLVKVNGAKGLGLRIADVAGRPISPSVEALPRLLAPRQDMLTYTITPQRTAAPLHAGDYWARVNFQLRYE